MNNAFSRPVVLAAMVISCGGEKTTEPALPPPAPTSLQLSATAVSLRIAETRQITATVVDQQNRPIGSQSISWRSSDTTRLTIDATGSVRALRPGAATLTATSGALTASVAGTVIAPTTQVEQTAAVSATIGPAGGQIDARASNGTRFILSVPPQALASDTTITVTPIASIADMPNGTTVMTAVRLQPDGLKFLAPVVLTMDLPAPPNPTGLSGMRIGDDGSLTLAPVTVNGSRLTMTIAHFSGAGVGNGLCGIPLAPIVGVTAADIALGELAYEQCNAGSGLMNATTVLNILHKWYTTSVKPGLQAATTSATATASFADWVHWRHTVDAYLSVLGPTSGINTDVAEAAPLAASVVKGEIARQNQSCIANRDLSAAANVFAWQNRAQSEQLVTSGSGLDLASVKAGLCVKVEIEQTNFPNAVAAGQAESLVVRAGLRFGTGAIVYSPSLTVTVSASGATPANSEQTTDAAGQASFTVTPGTGTVQLTIRAAPTFIPLESYGVFGEATIVRQASSVTVTITPVAAILDPGTQASFTATVTGTSNQAVTWTATGGTITPSGNYTAGSTAGTFQVKATSVAVPSKSATATVTILSTTTVVYENDFSGAVGTAWSTQNVTLSPNGQRFLGELQNGTVTLTLNQLPPHTKVTLEFDFYAIDTWDGNNATDGPDVFTVSVQNGPVLKTTTFSTVKRPGYEQAFPGNYPGSSFAPGSGGRANVLGYPPNNNNSAEFLGDAVYSLPFTFDHTGGAVVVVFRVNANTTSLTDERWGIDNIRVTVR